MSMVVGISLRTAGKLYTFSSGDQRYYFGERVLVETARGLELGVIKLPPHDDPAEDSVLLKPIMRRATAEDIVRDAANREREEQALEICRRLVEKLGLPMNLIDAQYTLDCSHILIHFMADNRVDFRELVRELARELHARIELRQVGVRDEAKLIGGYGVCGRKLCCSAFLGDFKPVAISMAKDQDLALNPQKISGSCGRLMCCLAFECDQYRVERANLPRMNAVVVTPAGAGKVTKLNVMSRMVEVTLPDAPVPIWYTADELLGKTAARSCCRSETGAPTCGGAFPEVPVEEQEEFVALLDPLDGPSPYLETMATLIVDGAMAEQPHSTTHHRRNPAPKSPQRAAPTPALPLAETSPTPLRAQSGAPASTAPAKRKRRRKPAVAPSPASVTPVPVPVGSSAPSPNVPAPRYRQRRRHTKGEE